MVDPNFRLFGETSRNRYLEKMASSKWSDKQFGQRLRRLREQRRWTQPQLAEKLEAHGISPMHATTIAKIEAGNRSVRVNEAVGIAEVFEVSFDALFGRHGTDDTSLFYALTVVQDYVGDLHTRIASAQGYLTDVLEMLEDVTARFEDPAAADIYRAAQALDSCLENDYKQALKLDALITAAAVETPPRSATRRRPKKSR